MFIHSCDRYNINCKYLRYGAYVCNCTKHVLHCLLCEYAITLPFFTKSIYSELLLQLFDCCVTLWYISMKSFTYRFYILRDMYLLSAKSQANLMNSYVCMLVERIHANSYLHFCSGVMVIVKHEMRRDRFMG